MGRSLIGRLVKCSQGRAAWQERERGRRCSLSEEARQHRIKQTEAHHRWMKRNRVGVGDFDAFVQCCQSIRFFFFDRSTTPPTAPVRTRTTSSACTTKAPPPTPSCTSVSALRPSEVSYFSSEPVRRVSKRWNCA